MNKPKYVQKDIEILRNYEFATDRWGYEINRKEKMALKLFRIAEKYPQKQLVHIINYFGLFDGGCDVKEEDYRDQILYEAEYFFIEAMNDLFLMYGEFGEKIAKQIPFIELGLIDCCYGSRKRWKKANYQPKYPSKLIY